MADKKKPINRIEDPGFEAIKNIGRKYESRGPLDAQERQRIAKAAESVNGLESLLEEHPELNQSKTIVNGLQESRDTLKKLSPRIELRRETHRERAINDTMASVQREFSDKTVNGAVRKAAETSSSQGRGLSMTGLSQRELEAQKTGIMSSIGMLEGRATEAVKNELYDKEGRQNPETLERLKATYRQKNALTNKAATIEAAIQKKKQTGEDDKSQDRSLFEIGKTANKTLFKNSVSQELQSGEGMGGMSSNQLKEKEVEQAKALSEALEKLKNSAGESAENIDKMREEAKGMAEGLKKTQEAIKQGGGEGGGIDKGALAKALVGQIPGILNTAAGAMQEALINQPMQTMGNRLGFASISNQQYAQRSGAINGNMTDLLNASKESGQVMSGIGENFKKNAEIVRGTNLVAGGVTAGLGVAQIAKGAGQEFNPIANLTGGAQVSEIADGVSTTVQGLAQVATSGADLINQTSASSANLGGQQMGMSLNNEVNKVRGDFRQSFFDYSTGTRQAALQAGGAGGQRIMNEFAADRGDEGGMLGRLQKARIAPNEFARLSGEGAAEQGSVYDSSSVFRARNLERSGVGSIDTNMQRMSTLAGAGANNPTAALGSVMEAAFSKGLDSSKALNMMVQNTGELVRTSVGTSAFGMDTTAGAAKSITSLVNENNPNKEAALSRAANAQQALQGETTGIGTNFSDMLGVTRIARTANISSVGAMAVKGLDDATARTLEDKTKEMQNAPPNKKNELEKQIGELLQGKGAGELVSAGGKLRTSDLQAGLQARKLSVLGGNALNTVDPNTEGFKELTSGKLTLKQAQEDPKYKKLLDELGRASVGKEYTGQELFKRVSGETGSTAEGVNKAKVAQSGEGGGKALQDADAAATAGGADMANKARLAAKELGGAAEALGKINKQIQSLVGNLNDKTSGSFQNAASDAAADFKTSAGLFGGHVDKFAASVNLFSRIPTSTGDAVSAALKPLVDKLGSVPFGGGGDGKSKNGPKG